MPGLLLAVETSTAATSVALQRGDALLLERRGPEGAPTATSLLPCLDALLREAGMALDAVDAFAVSIGPGSFTSLRIGLATVKGLVFGTARPVVAVPTLAALAGSAPEGAGPVVPMLDARRGEVYAGAYRPGMPRCESWLPEGVYTCDALDRALPAECRLVGEGAAIVGDALARTRGAGLTIAPDAVPRAARVAALGAGLLGAGEVSDAAELAPRYVRRAQAEVLRTGHPYEAPVL